MNGSKHVVGAVATGIGTNDAKRRRGPRIAPVTRAVRTALAVSAAAFAFAGSGVALAGDCTVPVDNVVRCNGDFVDTIHFAVEDLTVVVGDEAPSTVAPAPGDAGILADWAGDIGVTSLADIATYAANGIHAYGSGDIAIDNDGSVTSVGPGDIVGVYAYTDGGDVTIANSGSVYAYSYDALADGIFASGGNVDVANADTGSITAYGATWAAGIEAQGEDLTTVVNDGTIDAVAFGGGYSFGIYATAGDGGSASATNNGDIYANGFYSNGVYVQSGGDAHAVSTGTIVAGSLNYAISGTGIHAASSAIDGVAVGENSGDIVAQGYYGATGVEALALGPGGSATASNSGSIYAGQATKYYGSGAVGLVASADGDASVDNSGTIETYSGGMAYGAMALSFNGEASATNSGDISVGSGALILYAGYGMVAASQNDAASASNTGSITVLAEINGGRGIQASSLTGTSVDNAGLIDVDAKYAYAVFATSGQGDVTVSNAADGQMDVYSALGYATGIFASSSTGDVSVDNAGSILADGYYQAVGIFARPDDGTATVANSGDIQAYAYAGVSAGIYAGAAGGGIDISNDGTIDSVANVVSFGILGSAVEATVSNAGDISAVGYVAATGIDVDVEDLATVDNAGSITAVAYGDARGINATSVYGDIHVDSSGTIQAGSLLLDGIGIYAYSSEGDVAVHNDGVLVAVSPNGLADGIFAYGANAEVGNGASGYIGAFGYSWAAGIEAQGSDSVAVTNDGEIYARTYGVSEAFGIYAAGGEGGAIVDNNGSIMVRGYDSSVAIYAQASGSIDIHNAGNVLGGYYAYQGGVYSSSYAAGIQALSGADGAAITIDNSGTSTAISFSGSAAIEGRSLGVDGSVFISNSGYADAYALAQTGVATGIAASAAGDAMIDNSGGIFAYSAGNAEGAVALSFGGEASVVNSGDISVVNTAFLFYTAFGAVAASTNGSASVENSGTIDVTTPYLGGGIDVVGMEGASIANSGDVAIDAWVAYAVRASSGLGDVDIDNSGTIEAAYSGPYLGYSWGINAQTVGGDIAIDNSGDVSSDGGQQSLAVFASTTSGDIDVDSSGSVDSYSVTGLSAAVFATTTGDGNVSVDSSGSLAAASYVGTTAGAFARATLGTASITNSGDIESSSTYGTAYGVLTRGLYSGATNSGSVSAQGYAAAFGMYVDGDYGASMTNSGDVTANALGNAFGAYAYSFLGDAGITNSGDISAEGTYVVGVGALANGYYSATVTNSGSISGAAGPYGTAIGVYARAYGDVLVENSGIISASHDTVAVAVQMESLFGTATLDNSGTIETDAPLGGSFAVVGSNGANDIHNSGDINGAIVTFAADDSFTNGNGGTWLVQNYNSTFGGGDDSIVNGAGGTIHLAYGAISLGASGADGNSFRNAGTIRTSEFGVISMGAGASALENDGVISFVDGATDDLLVIDGDLGGQGAINLDVSLLNGAGDLLYVTGDVVDGTSQTVNLAIDGFGGVLEGASVQVVEVAGSAGADAFTGGTVLNFPADNFVDLGVQVSGDGAGAFNASVAIAGLNDAGVTAGSVANAAHSLINSSIGTRSQRLGVAPVLGDGDVGLGPWIRAFSDQGDVAPTASGFGDDRDFAFSQENTGTEFGMNLTLGNGINFGIMGGNAEGTQKLSYATGGDRIELDTSGLYAGWSGDRFYADASWRWMDFDATLMSVGGEQRTSGNATAFNFEGGYTGWTRAGVNFVPQLQYTRSVVDNIETVQGSEIGMDIHGGVSERVRVGVSLDHTFDGGNGFTWTPYGSLSAVRETDGNTGFTIADTFSGRTSTSGNSFLAELGLGVQKGRLSATGGIHLADGDALQGFYGGQLLVRYTW